MESAAEQFGARVEPNVQAGRAIFASVTLLKDGNPVAMTTCGVSSPEVAHAIEALTRQYLHLPTPRENSNE